MDKQFDFNKVGKQMPYTVPQNFFADMEKTIHERVAEEPQPAKVVSLHSHRVNLRWMVAAAACVAVLIVSGITFLSNQKTDMNDVEYAFSQLDEQDQDYVLTVSQDDIFINGQN
jgi:hypothetical protein